MLWILCAPTPDQAAALQASAEALWPAAPVEIAVAEPFEDALSWDGETLRWAEHAEPVASADAAVVLARSWLRDEDRELGWVPTAIREPVELPPEEAALETADLQRPRDHMPAWVGIGVGTRTDVGGWLNALRMHGGVEPVQRWSVTIALDVPVPNTRAPDWVSVELSRHPFVSYPVSGVGLSVNAGFAPWPWVVRPVALFGVGARQDAWRVLQRGSPEVVYQSLLDLGPEAGLAVQAGGPGAAVRVAAVDQVGLIDGAGHHGLLTADLLLRM